ncbi:uncharacterized protein PITG_21439 [Phytophthora infestans T30-4]|uniref:Uncharacterized protein n=1 Tax=Phytophthora infestans (strain T30-4) TaxID=403677 RepID=D0P436_PHYIT|nr:uncharacterized protein PITG_21439 [Phytophthora infestans T30-4]EEY62914.1 conserved hypothetical protein [Phytophthora infestans T30-4]|eukprot:XP_002894935.1 conserved hypothetical protein [Phytophthora infestans T30-4]
MATASSTPTFSHKQHLRLLEPSQAESAIRDIFSNVSAADVRQQAGKTDENAGEYHGDKAGKWPKTSEDVVFSTMSVKFNKALDNKGKDMFLSYPAQHEKKVSYGSSYENPISANVGNVYAKLPPAGVDHAYTKRLPAASRRRWSRSSWSSAAAPSACTRPCSGRSAHTGSRPTTRASMNECQSSKT